MICKYANNPHWPRLLQGEFIFIETLKASNETIDIYKSLRGSYVFVDSQGPFGLGKYHFDRFNLYTEGSEMNVLIKYLRSKNAI